MCPVFGTDEGRQTRSTREGLYINFKAPSQCRGNLISWRYCFYNSVEDEGTNNVKFVVYRRSSPTSDILVAVPGSITEVQLRSDISRGFTCQDVTATQRFEVQENDAIAACTRREDIEKDYPLYLVGESNNEFHHLYWTKLENYELKIVEVNDLERREGLILHLYAK